MRSAGRARIEANAYVIVKAASWSSEYERGTVWRS